MDKRKILIDCDTGTDDAIAIIAALYADNIDLVGLTAVNGNVPLQYTAQNTIDIVHYLGFNTPVAVGACAINGGLPALRNGLDVGTLMTAVYANNRPGLAPGSAIPNDPELPLPLARVHPLHEVVHIDHFLPGCPPSAEVIWDFLHAVVQGHRPQADPALIRYD